MRYTVFVEDLCNGPVNGLVDSRRAAALLGIPVNTFKVWAARSKTASAGIPADMPTPLATMHGSVYRVEDIEDFGRRIALSSRAPRSLQRSLGAYYTPDDASALMVQWALRAPTDVLLEPSVGDGQFAVAAQQLATSRGWEELDLHACELDPSTASRIVERGAVKSDRLHVGDFLAVKGLPMVDAVVGNPPFVRLRELVPTLRRNAHHAAAATLGQDMDQAGSVWMPFVSTATSYLKDGGRLALVLPLDFTYVRYARPLWEFLGRSFGEIKVIRFRERVFKDILQNVLILLADQKGETTRKVEVIAHESASRTTAGTLGEGASIAIDDIVEGRRVFQEALLPSVTRDVLSQLTKNVGAAAYRAKFNIGYVSGNKRFFHPDADTVRSFRLSSESLVPTIASSRQMSRSALRTSSMIPDTKLWLPNEKLTRADRAYVAQGEANGVDAAYKCRTRKPWYRVPGVKVPDVILNTFGDRPRLHLNDGGWAISNSALGGFLRQNESRWSFVSSWYSPITLLSAELEVHSLGGGVMVAVPREADAIKILDQGVTIPLDAERLDAALASGDTTAAYCEGGETIMKLVGTDGYDAIIEGVNELGRWRKAS